MYPWNVLALDRCTGDSSFTFSGDKRTTPFPPSVEAAHSYGRGRFEMLIDGKRLSFREVAINLCTQMSSQPLLDCVHPFLIEFVSSAYRQSIVSSNSPRWSEGHPGYFRAFSCM